MTTKIPLANGRGVALVDDADAELVSRYVWRRTGPYARGRLRGNRGADISMHVLLAGPGMDHANRNGLDNQRANLRAANRSQQGANRACPGGSSRYKGVRRAARGRRWAAQITVNKRQRHLGYFENEEDAARAYDTAALETWGPFALLNFPD